MKRLLLTLLISGMMISCSAQDQKAADEVTLSGQILNAPESAQLTLQKIWNNDITTVDTLQLEEDGSFSTNVKIDEPHLFRINAGGRQYVPLIIGENDVELTVNMTDRSKTPDVKGSEETEKLYAFSEMMNSREMRIREIDTKYRKAVNEKDKIKAEEIREEYMAFEKQYAENLKDHIRSMGVSVATFYALSTLDWDKEFVFADSVVDVFNKEMPDSKYTEALVSRADQMRSTAIGSVAPEIALPNPEGEIVKLSSLRGNYVLLDFWAAWCGPCRRENPNVVRMYNKYNDKGFEVYSVSLDKTKEKWLKAIEDDNLSWTHVSDLKYFNSEAAQTYQVQAIPYTLLLDKEGRIIGKNLRGKELENKLEEIFE